ncbi:MAG: hypothetical protein AB1814_10785 [Thermodesulfobacteriota bacterium]
MAIRLISILVLTVLLGLGVAAPALAGCFAGTWVIEGHPNNFVVIKKISPSYYNFTGDLKGRENRKKDNGFLGGARNGRYQE